MVASAKSFTATPKRGSSVSRGPTKTMSKTKSTNSTTRSKSALALERENTTKLPSSPGDMCGAAECLRPWLDDQCHCDACLFGNEKSGRTMSSMRNSGSRSEMSFTPKCMKEKFQKSRTSEASCGGCSSATLPNAGLEMLPHEKGNQTGESPKTPIQVTLVAPWEHSKSQATIKSGSSPTVTVSSRIQRGRSTSRGSRRNPSVESTPALPRPHCEMCGAAECLRPWLDDRCHCNTCLGLEEKECDSPRMKARRKSNPSCESFYASKCMKHEFEQRLNKIRSRQPTKFVMKQFSKSTASEDETNLNTLPALERHSSAGDPKKQETAQNTIRRTSLQSLSRVSTGARSHRSKSSRANPSVESIPALPRPHCEMCGAAECLRPWLDDRCHCNACLGLDKKECDSPRMKARRKSNPSCESFYASKCMKHEFELQTPVKSRQPMTTVEKKPSEARVKEEYILEKPSDTESLQTTQATLKSTSKRSRTRSRGRSLTRSRPDIESTPVLPRPHCEMCGAAECLRPWLDDRCHCDACLGLSVRRECESPRMRARRSSNPSCESFFASKCLKEKFESEPVGSLATKQRTLSRGGSRGFKTLPSVEKTIGEEPELSATLGPQKASSKQLEKQHTTLQEMKIQRSGSRVNPVAKVESKGDVSTGTVPLSRARISTARRTPELLLRPHCETCGANECLRPKLDERCHCAACIGLKDSECESPRMKARIANKPSCQSFYASKFLKHPAGSTKSKLPARRNSGESTRGNNITTLEDECCSPRHSPSSRLNASSTIKPMLLPILSKSRGRRDTVGDAQMPKKLKTNGEVTLEA